MINFVGRRILWGQKGITVKDTHVLILKRRVSRCSSDVQVRVYDIETAVQVKDRVTVKGRVQVV